MRRDEFIFDTHCLLFYCFRRYTIDRYTFRIKTKDKVFKFSALAKKKVAFIIRL